MNVNIHEIIEYYARANTSFAGIFIEHRALNSGNRNINRRTNPFCGGFVIPLTGSACFSLDGAPYNIQPGLVVHAGPNMRLDIQIPDKKPWRIAVIHYKMPREEEAKFPLFKHHFSFPIGENVKIPDLVQQLFQIQSTPGASAIFRGKRLFMNLMGELFDSSERHLATDSTVLIDQVMEYIRQNHAEPLSIVQIAARFNLDRRRLAPLFKRHVGMAPSDYLIECRILKAKELLYTCDCTIKQVSECVGYSDNLYFSRTFKKKLGISPSQYRESVKSTQ